MTGLSRDQLLTLLAAAPPATGDPLLPKRLADAAAIARGEEKIRRAAIKAFGKWTLIVRAAVLEDRRTVTAAAGEDTVRTPLPPDPHAMASLGPAWDSIAQASIVTSVGDLLGEVFGQYLLDGEGVISSRAWAENYLANVSNRLSGVPNETFDRMRLELQEGHDAGESIPHLRDRISNLLSTRAGGDANFYRQRATTIARTETTGAMNGGHLAAWRAQAKAAAKAALTGDDGGDDDGGGELDSAQGTKVWIATMDERTRPSHVAADGMVRPLDKPFDLMGGPLDFPGDGAGPASEVVNCRCTMMQLGPGESLASFLGQTRQLGQDTTGRDGVAEAAATDAEAEAAAGADAAALEAEAADTSDIGDVLAEADADAQAALEGDTPTTDPAGFPYKLSYDYLSNLTPEQLDDLEAHLVDGLAADDPLAGARWEDFETYIDVNNKADQLASELATGTNDDAVTRAIDKFLAENGKPGLTHSDVGGAPIRTAPSRAEIQNEYAVHLEDQYIRASQFCRGHMLSKAGERRDIDPRDLFGTGKGGIREVVRYASEELLEFWENDPRITWAQFYYERTGSEAYAERAAKAARDAAGIGRDRINPLTAAATADEPTDAQRAAYTDGRAAFTDGQPSTDCPFDLAADDPQALGLLWVRGYVYARRDSLGAAAVAAGLLDASWRLTGGPRQLTAAPQTPAPAGQDTPAPVESDLAPSEGPTMPPRTWRSDPFLAPFAVPTGDGRIFAVGSLTNRELPLPLLFQDSSAPGHDQSVVVGRILNVQFTDKGIAASGDYLDDPSMADTVNKAIALVEAGLGHVSVDLAACTGELVNAATGEVITMEEILAAWEAGEDPDVLEQVSTGELIACTQVATPAFGVSAKIAMSDGAVDGQIAPLPVPAPAEVTAAVDGDTTASMVDSAGNPLMAGDVVEVTVPAEAVADDTEPAGQEASAPPPLPGEGDPKPEGDKPAAGDKVKGRVSNIDLRAELVTVQPEDDSLEPLIVKPQDVTKVDGGDGSDADKPEAKPADPATKPAPVGASVDGAQTFDMADAIGGSDDAAPLDPTVPADPADAEPDDVAAVEGADDLALLNAVAPHYDAAAQLVRDAFASIKDDRVKSLAGDLVEDAASWMALLNYGLTPEEDEEGALLAAALVAGAGPMTPPAEWFDNPKLTGPTALTITEDGRVYGHAATWGTCHVGFSKTCITAPPSPSNYAYFHTGEVVCSDGSRVAVGNLTLGGRHADVQLAYRSAIEHYDVQGAGVAVVRMYEDEHGIAFAGALTPGITDAQLYDLRRSPVSGDWRRVGGNLEMIGCLSVNAPGFPTPRFRTDTAGRTALTAAPSVRPSVAPKGKALRSHGGVVSEARISQMIQAQIGKEVVAELGRRHQAEQRAKRLAVATIAVKGEPKARMAALAASVDGGRAQARRDRLAELAGTVTR